MPIPILMPALSPTMEQGKLAKWLVKEGDTVSSGDVIAEIETDKATMEVEAVEEGTVGRILVPEGTDGVAVNATIAILLGDGEDKSALDAAPKAAAPASASPPPSAAPSAPPAEAKAAAPAKTNGANGHGGRIFASPLARRVAKEKGVDLSALSGSGPHGRVVVRDIEKAVSSGVAPAAKPAAAAPAQALVPSQGTAIAPQPMPDEQIFALYEQGTYELVPHDNMRRTIAARLTQAKSTIPHFYLTMDCELDNLLEARQRLNMRSPKDGPNSYRLSVNDFIIKALGLALMRIPKANATWSERGTLFHKHADIAVAVAVEGGLFTPVIRSVDDKTLVEISHQMRDLPTAPADAASRRMSIREARRPFPISACIR